MIVRNAIVLFRFGLVGYGKQSTRISKLADKDKILLSRLRQLS